jgi:hypothetical protein
MALPIIDDLSRNFPEASVGSRWELLSDGVMGGLSSGLLTRELVAGRMANRMQGDVSLANNGGFIQMALDLAPSGDTVDCRGFTGLEIEVWGNSEQYGVHLRTAELSRPWQSYRQSFVAENTWRTIRLPFAKFTPHRTDQPLDLARMRRLGLVAIGRAFKADLALAAIRFF